MKVARRIDADALAKKVGKHRLETFAHLGQVGSRMGAAPDADASAIGIG
jgi:hypothetical protein